MRNRIDIDHIHSRAIAREIGERLLASLKPEPELPASLRTQMERLREFEAAEHWNKPRGLSRAVGSAELAERCRR